MKSDKFILVTCFLSGILSALYLAYAFDSGFNIAAWLVIGSNILYIPGAIFFKRKFFSYWSIVYSCIMVYVTAFYPTYLHCNFTAFFIISLVMLIAPGRKWYLLGIYLLTVSIMFMINKEDVIEYLLHLGRLAWLFFILNYYIGKNFVRKPLDLTEDEVKILEELNEKKMLKACTSFSKNTLTQKLKEARERNDIDTNAELLATYNLNKK